jgi:hypothetical protein
MLFSCFRCSFPGGVGHHFKRNHVLPQNGHSNNWHRGKHGGLCLSLLPGLPIQFLYRFTIRLPHTKEVASIFGPVGRVAELCAKHGLPYLGSVPLDPVRLPPYHVLLRQVLATDADGGCSPFAAHADRAGTRAIAAVTDAILASISQS